MSIETVKGSATKCPECKGTGKIMLLITVKTCPACGGSGDAGVSAGVGYFITSSRPMTEKEREEWNRLTEPWNAVSNRRAKP